VDGAGAWAIYFKIVIPMIRPALATGAILAFQLVWNNLETSNLFTDTESVRTLAFYMNTLSVAGGTTGGAASIAGQGMSAAASAIMFIPNLILFIILQSNVMNTMAHSGLK
jgi:ABC-type glycerol-3-phosphate transport system permease component